MFMRPLMLNPRRAKKAGLPPVGSYWFGTSPGAGYLMKVTWNDALGRLDFEPGTSTFTTQARPGVAGNGRAGLHSDTFPRRLNVNTIANTGVVQPPVVSYPLASLPFDWTVVSVLASGEVLQLKAGVYRVTNMITGNVGPQVSGASGFLNFGDGFALFSDYDDGTGGVAPSVFVPKTNSSLPGPFPARDRFRVVYDVSTDEAAATPLVGISSTGAWAIPFEGLPFAGSAFPGLSTRIRVGKIVVDTSGFARSGALLARVSGTCSEVYTGGLGFDGTTFVRDVRTTFSGYLRVSANAAIVVPTGVSRRFLNTNAIAYAQGVYALQSGDWTTAIYSAAGDAPTAYEPTGVFGTTVTDRQFDANTGIVTRLRLTQGGETVFDIANNSGGNRFTSIPHLGALVSWVFQGTQGAAKISFDYGATWRAISVRRATTLGGGLSADYPVDLGNAVPLFPYSG
jgi:hypothetical protein